MVAGNIDEQTIAGDRRSSASNAVVASRSKRSPSAGQAMVEFALLLPVLVLILALAGDFGRATTAYISISGAAREGAAYGMLSPRHATDTAAIRSAVLAETPSVWGVAPTVSSTTGTDAQGYTYVQVTVSYVFAPILAVGPIGDSYTMTRTVRMRVVG